MFKYFNSIIIFMGKFSGSNKVKKIVRINGKDYALDWMGTSKKYGGVELYSAEKLTPEPDPYYKLEFNRETIKKEKSPSKNLYYFLIGAISNHGEERKMFIENFVKDKFLDKLEKRAPLKLTFVSVLGASDVKVVGDFYGIKYDCLGNMYGLASITNSYSEDSEYELFLASLYPEDMTPTEVKKALDKANEYRDHEIFEKKIEIAGKKI